MKVLAKPFRDRYRELLDQGTTASEIAVRCGYVRNRGTDGDGDVSRLRRNLRMEKGKKLAKDTRYISYDVAVVLARAMDMDPIDAGV